MASIDSLRYFPVVKIVSTSMFGEGHTMSRIGEIALRNMAAHILETLDEIKDASETENGFALLRTKLDELRSQLDRIKKYLENSINH